MPFGVTFLSISSGSGHICALSKKGQPYCWGDNSKGQLGNGGSGVGIYSDIPVAVTMPAGVVFSVVTLGFSQTCALSGDGNAFCWGQDIYGAIGDGDGGDKSVVAVPTAVAKPQGVTFTTLSTGYSHTCALDPVGFAHCWGYGEDGQLGNGKSGVGVSENIPVAVTMPEAVTFIAIENGARYHTCGIKEGGIAYCWGGGKFGQLGNGNSESVNIPTPVTMPAGVTFSSISLGYDHTCALDAAGKAFCWGSNGSGQLGSDIGVGSKSPSSNIPTAVTMPIGVTFTAIAAGYSCTCALASDDNTYCWGTGGSGQLGNGSALPKSNPTVVK